ncbi:glycosyltransferase group 1 family protein [Bacteroides intestinalis CAG:315]|nr:glycosyltransferase group 1 family protein [Bacteroides intestinalis CAG:315]
MADKRKLIRITTVSDSLNYLLKGQLRFLSFYFDVIAIGSDNNSGQLKEVEEREGVHCIDVLMYRKISIWHDIVSLFRLINLFRKVKPCIVHTNTPKASLLSMIAAWVTHVPHRIYTVTGLRFETTTGKFHWLLVSMEKITCWCATKVIPEGEGVKKTLITNGITKKKMKVLLNGNINGVDVTHYSRSLEVMKRVENIKEEGTFNFVFVGRLVKDKGINELVIAFSKLSVIYSDIRLHLIGNFERELDPLREDVEKKIEEEKTIVTWGFQSDVRPFFAASDVLVFPSYREGFPNVVLQAGAMGLPSIVTDISGCNEIIQERVNGKIIPPQNEEALYEAMKWFYEHRNGEVREMAKCARPIIIERYEQHKVWNALLEEYQTLINL